MMTKLFSGRAYYLIAFGVPLALMAALASLTSSSMFAKLPSLTSTAIIIDYVLIVPLVYLALIWRRSIPNTTAMPVLILGIIVASFVIPQEHQTSLEFVKTWIVPVIELVIIGFIVTKVWRLIRIAKAVKDPGSDFLVAVRTAASEMMGRRIGGLFASEIGMIYYGILGGKKAKSGDRVFFYHRNTTSITIMWAFFVLLIVETGLLHLFLVQWSEIVAWIIFVLSIYSGIQFLAILRATTRRPTFIADGKLYLRFSVLREAVVELANIDQVQINNQQPEEDEVLNLNPINHINEHNVILRLKQPSTLQGFLGFEKPFKTLLLHVDEPDRFQISLNENARP
jgi:hypothetical protein